MAVAANDVLSRALALARLRDSEVSWSLLRADSAPVIAAVLGVHLAGETRRMPVSELVELVDDDLDALRAHGETLPRSAQGYCADWRAAGYLVRRPADDARGEIFELSAGALAAIRHLETMAQPRATVTESRLTSIAHQLSRLALDTDPDATRRLAQLREQRDAIDREIARAEAGEVDVLGADRATERMRDILTQASELPADFSRVRERFEGLNRFLRERLIESDDAQRLVVDDIFRGVDLIGESDEGRSFGYFLRLVLDPERGAEFESDVDRVLDRDFARALAPGERRTLRRLLGMLKAEGADIHDVISTFARGLRRYVQSQQYQRDRALRSRLQAALAAGVRAAPHIKPYRETSVALDLSMVPMRGVGAIRLHNPAAFDATTPIVAHEVGVVDWEALGAIARDTEIDFSELESHVAAVRADTPDPSVADVLTRFPASQGVASVVGLLALATAHAAVGTGVERVHWSAADGTERAADVPLYRFVKELV